MAQRIEVTRAEPTMVPEIASVLLTVPAHKDYVVIVRSAVAHLGACFGFTIGEVGDLRLAVDEACNLLIAGQPADAPVSGLECRAGVRGDLLRVTVAGAVAAADPPDTESIGWTILAALVDALSWEHDGRTVRVELEKRRGLRDG